MQHETRVPGCQYEQIRVAKYYYQGDNIMGTKENQNDGETGFGTKFDQSKKFNK